MGRPVSSLSSEATARLRVALCNDEYVAGLTHEFYRYPARFSPAFVRTAVSLFSRPGDTVLDPFVGGGTTAVEALATGRRVIGVDLNSLAVFVTRVKTTPLSARERADVLFWIDEYSAGRDQPHFPPPQFGEFGKDVPRRIQVAVNRGLVLAAGLSMPAERFARAVLLRVSQWALDGREELPRTLDFVEAVNDRAHEMLDYLDEFAARVRESGVEVPSRVSRACRIAHKDTAELRRGHLPVGWKRPRLVVTSPPYMGVHVLYNKWQVHGRRETKFPYAVSGTTDGYFASHYTFGARYRATSFYKGRLTAAFRAVRTLMAPDGLVLQLVSFARPATQLPLFLEAMEKAGFVESLPASGRRIWRPVPNRKWYVRAREGVIPQSREVLLVHRPFG